MEKIFISVISCKERYLEETIKSALSNAEIKSRVHIGVVNTVLPDDEAFIFQDDNVIIKNIYSPTILGVGFSRKKAIDLCPNEIDYILQVDAHTVFAKNWDSLLIDFIKQIEKNTKHNKIIISQHLSGFVVKKNNTVFIPSLSSEFDPFNIEVEKGRYPDPVCLSINNLNRCLHEGYPASWGQITDWKNNNYLENSSICGGFVFSRKKMFEEIPHDKRCAWGADESVFGMRAWTRGYKIYTIKKFILFHLIKFEFDEEGVDKNSWRLEIDKVFDKWQNTYLVIKNIFTGKEFGIFGALNEDKLIDYENFTNFNFKNFYEQLYKKYNNI